MVTPSVLPMATAAVPEYWPALAFFLIATLWPLAPAQTVFSGFHSSTFWLFFGGIVLGIAIRHTGLGQRIALRLATRLGRTYAGVIVGGTPTEATLGGGHRELANGLAHERLALKPHRLIKRDFRRRATAYALPERCGA
ncbi:anion permease [Halomonas maura]|uniref:anion permease n=1 Tax=Halomonas maura TaxID=117606 RepID=UPI0025B40C68|nr:SLC13 family permease [Halomonas maura]MDN3557486.1 anion permease [Halomonas maura]